MNVDIYAMLLLIVVAWPLLLAIPALHSRLPWPHHLAIMPAVVLMILPGEASLELPWLFFGTGFAIDGDNQWILGMSVAIWLMAATIAKNIKHDFATPFFLLTLAGNLGVILAADLVGFFVFSAFMGYGFYGLLIYKGDAEVWRAGRLYLIFLVLADLALFEALLLAAFTMQNLRFEEVRHVMAEGSSSQFYIWMVLIGFAFKTGIWPVHLWLSAAFRSVSQLTMLLLGGVPVTMGLFGVVRWLPIGEHVYYVLGTAIQMLGVVAMLYVVLRLLMPSPVKLLPAWASTAVSGLFIAALGTGLSHPVVWHQYEHLIYPFIAILGIFLAVFGFAIGRLPETRRSPALVASRAEAFNLWVERWIGTVRSWAKDRLLGFQSHQRASQRQVVKQYQRILNWQKPGGVGVGWSTRISLFVLLGLALAWLAG